MFPLFLHWTGINRGSLKMRKKVLFTFIMLLVVLAGCSSTSFTGESDHWAGAYVSHEEDGVQYGTFTIVSKQEYEDGIVVEYNIEAEEDFFTLEGSSELISDEFEIEQECTDCHLHFASRAIVIELTWDGKSEELILR